MQPLGDKEAKFLLFGDNDPRNDPLNNVKQTLVPKRESDNTATEEFLLILGATN